MIELEHPNLELFEPIVTKLLDTAFTGGFKALESHGFKTKDFERDPRARSRFIRGCHYGYDKVQKNIGRLVIHLEGKVVALETELKQIRQKRPRQVELMQKKILELRILGNRQKVLRKIIDAILFATIEHNLWVIRRLCLESQVRRVNTKTILKMLNLASDLNSKSRYKFYLVTDLTTFVHLGDLVEVDFSGDEKKWRIIEIKEGKMNKTLLDIIQDRDVQLSPDETKTIEVKYGHHAAKQVKRMITQKRRITEFEKIIKTDHGIDPKLGKEINILPETFIFESFQEALSSLIDHIYEKGVSAITINKCLRLFGFKAEMLNEPQIGLSPDIHPHIITHAFFHMANPKILCKLLLDPEQAMNELKEMELAPSFFDFVRYNLNDPFSWPIFFWGKKDQIYDLLAGRIRLFIQFDMKVFFELAEESGVKMTWVTGKETEELRKVSSRIPGSLNSWGVKIELPDGTTQTLLSGFFGRIFSELRSPKELIELIKEIPNQFAKVKDKNKTS